MPGKRKYFDVATLAELKAECVERDPPVDPFAMPVEGKCWIWGAHLKSHATGYHTRPFRGRNVLVHRISVFLRDGSFPAKRLVTDHLCRATHCCNPDHLDVVTHRENSQRGRLAKNRRFGACHQCGNEALVERIVTRRGRYPSGGCPVLECPPCQKARVLAQQSTPEWIAKQKIVSATRHAVAVARQKARRQAGESIRLKSRALVISIGDALSNRNGWKQWLAGRLNSHAAVVSRLLSMKQPASLRMVGRLEGILVSLRSVAVAA